MIFCRFGPLTITSAVPFTVWETLRGRRTVLLVAIHVTSRNAAAVAASIKSEPTCGRSVDGVKGDVVPLAGMLSCYLLLVAQPPLPLQVFLPLHP